MKTYYIYLLAVLLFACKNKKEQLFKNEFLQSKSAKESTHIDTSHEYEKRTGTSGNYEYTYNVVGMDNNENEVTGTVIMNGEFGSGYIIDANGDEQTVKVKWIDYGLLKATDSKGNEYEVKTKE